MKWAAMITRDGCRGARRTRGDGFGDWAELMPGIVGASCGAFLRISVVGHDRVGVAMSQLCMMGGDDGP